MNGSQSRSQIFWRFVKDFFAAAAATRLPFVCQLESLVRRDHISGGARDDKAGRSIHDIPRGPPGDDVSRGTEIAIEVGQTVNLNCCCPSGRRVNSQND